MSERPHHRARNQHRSSYLPSPFPFPFPYDTSFNFGSGPTLRPPQPTRPSALSPFFPSGHWSLFPQQSRNLPYIHLYPQRLHVHPTTRDDREEDEGNEEQEEGDDSEDINYLDDEEEDDYDNGSERADSQNFASQSSRDSFHQQNLSADCFPTHSYTSSAPLPPLQTMPTGTNRLKRPRASDPDHTDSPGRAPKRRRLPDLNSASQPVAHVDLSGDAKANEDDEDAAQPAWLQKQTAETVRAQQPLVPSGKSKLTTIHCTVCLEPPTDLTATSCGHVFCRSCLYDWLRSAEKDPTRRPNCPACRKQLRNFRTSAGQNPRATRDVVNLCFMKKPTK